MKTLLDIGSSFIQDSSGLSRSCTSFQCPSLLSDAAEAEAAVEAAAKQADDAPLPDHVDKVFYL